MIGWSIWLSYRDINMSRADEFHQSVYSHKQLSGFASVCDNFNFPTENRRIGE